MLSKRLTAWIAGALSGVLLCGMLPVQAEETVETITWEKSDALYFEVRDESGNVSVRPLPDSKITGQIAVTVHDVAVHVTITGISSEGTSLYYDVDLAPQADVSATCYIFLLDYSEVPLDPSQFENTYTSPYLTQVYNAAYQITISNPDNSVHTYTESSLVIADPHAEPTITGTTQYAYDITTATGDTYAVSASGAVADVSETRDLTVTRNLQFLQPPYTLGDVDDNQQINTTDAYHALQIYAGDSAGVTEDIDGILREAADVNKDGQVNTTDAFFILLYYANISAGQDVTLDDVVNQRA